MPFVSVAAEPRARARPGVCSAAWRFKARDARSSEYRPGPVLRRHLRIVTDQRPQQLGGADDLPAVQSGELRACRLEHSRSGVALPVCGPACGEGPPRQTAADAGQRGRLDPVQPDSAECKSARRCQVTAQTASAASQPDGATDHRPGKLPAQGSVAHATPPWRSSLPVTMAAYFQQYQSRLWQRGARRRPAAHKKHGFVQHTR